MLEQITSPVSVPDPVDTDDFRAAAERPATMVTTTDEALREALEGGDFGRWKVFLHPTQSRLVEREYSGPARVGGGPGTGKTIVALHRVKHLVDRLPPGRNKPVLLTTYNKNLAADLRSRLLQLGGEKLLARVEISHVDQLALRVVREAEPGSAKQTLDESQALREWRAMLDELGETGWDVQFLHDEWSQVILGQAVVSRTEYFRARRAGRGKNIARAERAEIWQLAERFTQRLDRLGRQTWEQVAERAARLEMDRERRIQNVERQREEAGGLDNIHLQAGSAGWLRHRFQHIVVDEAQDLRAAHWKLLRAMAPRAANDIFLVGDTHQRIYGNQVTLGSLGVHIRGRSAKLTLSYRTTRQILGSALGVLSGESFDDLDGSSEDLAGYRSVLTGSLPQLHGCDDWESEQESIAALLADWIALPTPPGQIAVCVPTNAMASELAYTLLAHKGIKAVEIGPEGPRGDEGVHIGTMFRFKGLEYQRMVIAGFGTDSCPGRRSPAYGTPMPSATGASSSGPARCSSLRPPGPGTASPSSGTAVRARFSNRSCACPLHEHTGRLSRPGAGESQGDSAARSSGPTHGFCVSAFGAPGAPTGRRGPSGLTRRPPHRPRLQRSSLHSCSSGRAGPHLCPALRCVRSNEH